MLYAEFPPRPELAHAIHCIWVFETDAGDAGGPPQTIFPDGHPELILHYGDQFHEHVADQGYVAQSRILLAGQISRPLVLQAGRRAGVIAVRLQPAAARTLVGVPMREATDARLDLNQVWGRAAEHLLDQLHDAPSVEAKARLMEQAVARRLAQALQPVDMLIQKCVAALQTHERISIDALATASGLSGRQLERRFLDQVGIPPRLLASITRFRRLFDALETQQPVRWVERALAAGYFDQAHMIRDFKRFAGCTPRDYLRHSPGLAAALNGVSHSYNS